MPPVINILLFNSSYKYIIFFLYIIINLLFMLEISFGKFKQTKKECYCFSSSGVECITAQNFKYNLAYFKKIHKPPMSFLFHSIRCIRLHP